MRTRLAAAVAAVAMLVGGVALVDPAAAQEVPSMLQFEQQVTTATPVDNPELIDEQVSNITTFYLSPVIDVRAYNSYQYRLEARNDGGATYLATDVVLVKVTFYADALATTAVFTDSYTIYPTNALGSSPVQLTDQMHGAHVRIAVSDPNGTGRTFRLTHSFYGSFRPLANAYLRTSSDGELYNATRVLAAAANDGGQPATLGMGRAMLTVSTSAGTATASVRLGGTGVNQERYLLTATGVGRFTQEFILPKQQAFIVITNTAAVNNTIRASMFQLVQPY